MQLPEFIKRALGFFDSTESRLAKLESHKAEDDDGDGDGDCPDCEGTGKNDGKECITCGGSGKAKDGMKKAQARVIELEGQLSAANSKASDLQGQLTAKDGEISTLKGQLDAAGKKANDVIAAQGLSPDQLPPAEPNAKIVGAPETLWAKYNRLLTENPRAAGQFWQENADKILDSRPK